MYDPGVVTAPPPPALTTIVDDVRPPIVVVAPKGQEQKDDQSTTAFVHKAEPGRDVFAGGADKEGKSSSYSPPKQPEEKKEKQVSSVGVPPAQMDRKDANGIAAFESKPIISSTKTTTPDTAIEVDQKVKEKPKPRAGAPDEGELEAEKAAKELFPETS